jgi:RNA polymerase sigma-70 factor (ECF subfamily)
MREGDFERLYSEHAQPLFGFLVYRTGDRTLAEDILTETFVRVLKSRRSFDRRKGSEKTWIYAIALNLLKDHGRRKEAEGRALGRAVPIARASGPDSAIAAIEDRDTLQRAMHVLSNFEREVVALRFGAGMTSPEIAEVTGERITTIEGRVYRALRKLRDELGMEPH